MTLNLLATGLPQVASASGDLVSNLLTGGGFVFLAAIVGGLALWNKNQSESAKSIAEGSREFVEGARAELMEAKKEAKVARDEAKVARAEVEAALRQVERLQDLQEDWRRKMRIWMWQQRRANDEHNEWDNDLKAEVERLGGHIREAPPLPTCSPDDPNFPKLQEG